MFVAITGDAIDVNLLFLLWEKKEDYGNEMECQNKFTQTKAREKKKKTQIQ